jgi:hypothetical protein
MRRTARRDGLTERRVAVQADHLFARLNVLKPKLDQPDHENCFPIARGSSGYHEAALIPRDDCTFPDHFTFVHEFSSNRL